MNTLALAAAIEVANANIDTRCGDFGRAEQAAFNASPSTKVCNSTRAAEPAEEQYDGGTQIKSS